MNDNSHVGTYWIDPNYGSKEDAFEVKCTEDHIGIGTCIKAAITERVSCSLKIGTRLHHVGLVML